MRLPLLFPVAADRAAAFGTRVISSTRTSVPPAPESSIDRQKTIGREQSPGSSGLLVRLRIERCFDFPAQRGQDFAFKPGIAIRPDPRPPGRMRQRKVTWQVASEIPHPLTHRAGPQHTSLRIAPNQQRQPDGRHRGEQPTAPERGALGTWGSVAAICRAAGIAKPHRQDCDPPRIVELLLRQASPFAKPVSGSIGKRNSRSVHFAARRLARDQKRRGLRYLKNRPWT